MYIKLFPRGINSLRFRFEFKKSIGNHPQLSLEYPKLLTTFQLSKLKNTIKLTFLAKFLYDHKNHHQYFNALFPTNNFTMIFTHQNTYIYFWKNNKENLSVQYRTRRTASITPSLLVITALTQIRLARFSYHHKLTPLFVTSLQCAINNEYLLGILYRIIRPTFRYRLHFTHFVEHHMENEYLSRRFCLSVLVS
jgi:hypothetical protein